ncbi:MAG: YkoF family thiamine/hydroxymethylpyrimidine-binding protein [Bacillota bacterium]|nr:YkoF family thiamine/hydroxymethylpyrimidine-binding protein [Bacillota bacterium]
MICAEVSLYPLKTNNASSVINNSIQSLDNQKLEYKVGSISTHLHGNEDQVWQGLQQMFHQAQANGEVSMVVTITNAAD